MLLVAGRPLLRRRRIPRLRRRDRRRLLQAVQGRYAVL